MTTKRKTPDLPAKQTFKAAFELRSMETRGQGSDESLVVEGHASVFGNEYDVYGGPPYGWIERIQRGAFDETLKGGPDVVFLLNHEGMPLARSKSGTLELETDDVGLMSRATLDLANPLVTQLRSALDRGDIDEMSFAFRATEQVWSEHPEHRGDDESLRTITKVNINRGDVSAVTFGASPETDIDIIRSLNAAPLEELAEARAVIERRMAKQDPDGTSGDENRGGMPPHLLELLRIPDNPELQEYLT